MRILLKRLLINKLLGIPEESEAMGSQTIANDSGEGRFAPERFLEGDANCFDAYLPARSNHKKPALIFSAAVALDAPLENDTFKFLQFLIQHYDIFICASKSDLNHPIKSAKELLNRKNEIPLLKRSEIERRLSEWGETVNQYTILDDKRFCDCFDFFKTDDDLFLLQGKRKSNFLRTVDILRFEEFKQRQDGSIVNVSLPISVSGSEEKHFFEAHHIDVNEITELSLDFKKNEIDPNEIVDYLNQFKNLKKLILLGDEYLIDFCNSNLCLKLNLPCLETVKIVLVGLKENKELKLPIENTARNYGISAEGDHQVQLEIKLKPEAKRWDELVVSAKDDKYLIVSLYQSEHLENLKRLALMNVSVRLPHEASTAVLEICTISGKFLKEVIIDTPDIVEFPFSDSPHVQVLNLKAKTITLCNVTDANTMSLKNMHLECDELVTDGNVFPQLQVFTLASSSIFNFVAPKLETLLLEIESKGDRTERLSWQLSSYTSLRNLFLSYSGNGKVEKFDFSSASQLEILHLKFLEMKKQHLNFKAHPHLRSLTLNVNRGLKTVDLSGSTKLEELDVSTVMVDADLRGISDCKNLRRFAFEFNMFGMDNPAESTDYPDLFNRLKDLPHLEEVHLDSVILQENDFQLPQVNTVRVTDLCTLDNSFEEVKSHFPNARYIEYQLRDVDFDDDILGTPDEQFEGMVDDFQSHHQSGHVEFSLEKERGKRRYFSVEGISDVKHYEDDTLEMQRNAEGAESASNEANEAYIPAVCLGDDEEINDETTEDDLILDEKPALILSVQKFGATINLDNIRGSISNTLELNGEKIVFKLNSDSAEKVIPRLGKRKNDFRGLMHGHFYQGRRYPLQAPGVIGKEDLHEVELISESGQKLNSSDYDIFYDEKIKIYFLVLKKEFDGKAFYYFSILPGRHFRSAKNEDLPPPEYDLPSEIRAVLDHALVTIPALTPLFDTHTSNLEKLTFLKKYCCEFGEGASPQCTRDIDKLLEMIKEQKGVCGSRAQAFMLLVLYFRLADVCLVGNSVHQFCEITGRQGEVYKFDLGGLGDVKQTYDYHLPSEVAETRIPIIPVVAPSDAQRVDRVFDELTEIKQLDHWTQLGDPTIGLSSAIVLPSSLSGWKVCAHLMAHHHGLHIQHPLKDVIFIEDPTQFRRLFETFKIVNGRREKLHGPLHHLMHSTSSSVLLVDWRRFTPQQCAKFMSISDDNPNLFGISFSPFVRVIGLVDQIHHGSAFSTRMLPYSFSTRMQSEILGMNTYSDNLGDRSPVVVNLAGRKDWYSLLIQRIHFIGNHIRCEPGALIDANSRNHPLVLINPPSEAEDPRFHDCLNEMRFARRLLYQGLYVPVSVHIHARNEETNAICNQVQWMETDEALSRIPFSVNEGNIHQLFENVIVSEGPQFQTRAGWLSEFNEQQHVFLISGRIRKKSWEGIIAEIQKNFPNKKFVFCLGANASVEGVKESALTTCEILSYTPAELATNTIQFLSNYFITHDPDALLEQFLNRLRNKNVVVVDVTPQTSYSKLIASLKLKIDDTGLVHADYLETDLLEKIVNQGCVLILKGLMSLQLHAHLQAWLENRPLWINGNLISLTSGIVISIMPEEAIERFELTNINQFRYTLEDYFDLINVDEEMKFSIRVFIELMKRMPEDRYKNKVIIDFYLIQSIVDALTTRIGVHSNNYIKSTFITRFPEDSVEYAYLCVVAKIIFDKSSGAPFCNTEKLKQCLARYTRAELLETEKVWFLLNCFNPAMLRFVFYDIHPNTLTQGDSNPFPRLNPLLRERACFLYGFQGNDTFHPRRHFFKVERDSYLNLLYGPSSVLLIKTAPNTDSHLLIDALRNPVHRLEYKHGLREINSPTFKVYQGIKEIQSWLEHAGDNKPILYISDPHLFPSELIEQFKSLSRFECREFFYEGRLYPLTNHRVIIEVQTNSTLFLNHATTLNYKAPYDNELKEGLNQFMNENRFLFIAPRYRHFVKETHFYFHLETYCQCLVKAARLAEKELFIPVSLRHLKNIVLRCFDQQKGDDLPTREAVLNAMYQSCLDEYEYETSDKQTRVTFRRALSLLFFEKEPMEATSLSEGRFISGTTRIYVPSSHRLLVQRIEQDLRLWEQSPHLCHTSLILEGESGLGKSTLYKALLEERGFKQATRGKQESGKLYFELSGSVEGLENVTEEAKQKKAVLVLNEINLDQRIQSFLLPHLADQENPLRILASYNPSSHAGRVALSQTFLTYFHRLYMDPYEDEALKEILSANGVASHHVESFKSSRGNARTLFTWMRQQRSKGASQREKREVEDAGESLTKRHHRL